MARTIPTWAAAAAVLVTVAEAGNGKWNQVREAVPRQTLAQMEMDEVIAGWSPKPTPAPKPRRELVELDERAITENGPETCGYVDGIETLSLYCDPASVCVANSIASQVGCCPQSNTQCNIWTTCLNSDEGDRYTTDDGLTMWCGFDDYPSCVTHVYYDEFFSGYSLFGCGRTGGKDSVFYLPTADAASETSRGGSTGSLTGGTLFPTDDVNDNDDDDGNSDNTTDDEDEDSTDVGGGGGGGKKKGGASTGGIVGGVVGGVAGIAGIGLAAFFFKKRRGKKDDATSPAAAGFGGQDKPTNSPPPMAAGNMPASTYPPHSPMQHQQQPGMMNNGMAMGYPPSTPGSPPPQGNHIPSMYSVPGSEYGQQHNAAYPYGQQPTSPPPPGGYPSPGYAPQPLSQQPTGGYSPGWGQPPAGTPPPAGQHPPPQQPGFVAELPTEKSHGEVRELAG